MKICYITTFVIWCTCEGVDYPEFHAFSLQFHPEAHGGPLDCLTAFDRFTAMMKEGL